MKRNRSRWLRPFLILALTLSAVAAAVFPVLSDLMHPIMYIRSDSEKLVLQDPFLQEGEVAEETHEITRGTKVRLEERGETESRVSYNGSMISIPNENLAESLIDVVDYDYVYPRRLLNLRNDKEGSLSDEVVTKGEQVKVVSALASDLNAETGVIAWYEVEKDGQTYYLPGGLVETSRDLAMKDYGTDIRYNAVYDNRFWDGYSEWAYIEQPDFKGLESTEFTDNPLPDDVHGIHITLENLIKYKDDLIRFKNETGINALVVALKGVNGQLFYESEVPQKYFNSTDDVLANPLISKKDLKKLVSELQQAGFFMIGRMETFGDSMFALDRPDLAVVSTSTGEPLRYSESYWGSPYNRTVWEYNGDLAVEFADLGFNEVEFDFCRFPDAATNDEVNGLLDYRNKYNESKVGAIQGFVYYIRERLAPHHVYTAVDTYSGPVAELYDYDIGQFYPAIANAADVVSPMIYLDTFPFWDYGYQDMENEARAILKTFTENALDQQGSTTYSAQYRPWIQGYNNTNPERLQQEILGIVDAGEQGYLVWTDEGSMDTLRVCIVVAKRYIPCL